MDAKGFTGENPQSDTSYTSHVWYSNRFGCNNFAVISSYANCFLASFFVFRLLPFEHVLQYTHFLNVYIKLLSAWDLIKPRANYSSQWYKVLTWLHTRIRPDFYHLGLAEPVDRKSQVFISPRDWRPQRMPAALPHLLNLPAIQREVIIPTGFPSSFATTNTANTSTIVSGHLLRCVICNITARGVIAACPLCHHGGHMEHMTAWCVQHSEVGDGEVICPSPNCGCRCRYLRINAETNPTSPSALMTTSVQ